MNEAYFRTEVILETPTATGRDGVVVFSSSAARALVLDAVSGPDKNGNPRNKTVFLVKSDIPPQPGGKIRWKDQCATIGMVKVRLNFEGNVEAYYCAALS